MRRALASFALLFAGAQAEAFEACVDAGKGRALDRESREARKALPERRFADLEARFGGMLVAMDKGVLGDASVDRAFRTFEALELGDCTQCGSKDPAPLLREWGRRDPTSSAARLALGYHATSLGFAARRDKDELPVTGPAVEAMNAAFREALEALSEAERLGSGRMLTSSLRIRIAAANAAAAGGSATELYRKAIAAEPRNATARVRYAEASLPKWGGSPGQIESILGDTRGLDRGSERYVRHAVHHVMGVASEAAHDDAAAARHYKQGIALCPGLTNSSVRLLELQMRTRDYQGAVATASALVDDDRTNGWARALRGKAYRELGKYKESYADYESAAELGFRAAFEPLAWFYETGTAVPLDLRRALELYGIAADRGSPTARASIARLRKSS